MHRSPQRSAQICTAVEALQPEPFFLLECELVSTTLVIWAHLVRWERSKRTVKQSELGRNPFCKRKPMKMVTSIGSQQQTTTRVDGGGLPRFHRGVGWGGDGLGRGGVIPTQHLATLVTLRLRIFMNWMGWGWGGVGWGNTNTTSCYAGDSSSTRLHELNGVGMGWGGVR